MNINGRFETHFPWARIVVSALVIPLFGFHVAYYLLRGRGIGAYIRGSIGHLVLTIIMLFLVLDGLCQFGIPTYQALRYTPGWIFATLLVGILELVFLITDEESTKLFSVARVNKKADV